MKMKELPLSLFVFATVFLLSCAFPQDTRNGKSPGLVDSAARENPLQKRKPPRNVPGPKLTPGDLNPASMIAFYDHVEKTDKRLSYGPDREKRNRAELVKNARKGNVGPLDKNNDENYINSSGDGGKENEGRGVGLYRFLD